MTNQKTLTLTHQFLNNLSTSTREMLIEATNNPPTQNPFQTISDFDLKQKAVAELKSNGLSFRKCSYDKKYYLRKAPTNPNHSKSTLHNDIFECENIIVSIYNELKKETLSEAQCKNLNAEDLFYTAIYSLKTLYRIVKQNGHDSAARKLDNAMDSIDDIWENDLQDARWEGLNKEKLIVAAPAFAPVKNEEAQVKNEEAQVKIIEAIWAGCTTCEELEQKTGLELNDVRDCIFNLSSVGLISEPYDIGGSGVFYFSKNNDYTFEELQNALKQAQAPAPAPVEEAQHYAIVQRSSDTVLVVGESAEDATREYCIEYEEATKTQLTGSWYSDQDTVLVPCTEFLYTKALAGDDIIYFWDEGLLNCYITEVEDFTRSDSCLSTEYNEGCHSTAFDNYYNSRFFNLKEYLIEVANNYNSPLDYEDTTDIYLTIEEHFSDDHTKEYDTIVFALCTESNQYPDGQFKLDGEDRYCLSFDRSDAVLILKKG